MSWIDWILFIVPVLVVLSFSVYAQRFVKSVADFLVANRAGGRYLLTAADGIAGIGVISFVATLESYHQAGWALSWWSNVGVPVGLILSLTGFVYYRYRQTRVLTMAQFFEIRYSRRYRIGMGFLCYLSGILNFGIFPAITTQFFMDFLQIPPAIGGVAVYPALMLILLGTAAIITISGGQIQNMVTDTVQALFSYGICVIIGIGVVFIFSIDEFRQALTSSPAGYSLVDPFDTGKVKDFNIYYVALGIFSMVYIRGAWQGSQGYAGAAINPHESKMGGVLNTWRQLSLTVFVTMVAMGALTYLKLNPEFRVLGTDGEIIAAPKATMVAAISHYLPIGFKGLFAALMFFFMLSTDTTYMHSWGAIFVQDVALPIYGRPVSQKTHLLLLRLSIAFVAIFVFCFSMFYQQNDFIAMFQKATGAFFTAAGGCAIIGGLYWKYGNKVGAWSSMAVGVLSSSLNLFMMDRRGWQLIRELLLHISSDNALLLESTDKCPINGAWLGFLSMLLALTTYIVVSLLTCRRRPFNMDKMLHLNAYAEKADTVEEQEPQAKIAWWKQFFLGFDHEFTRWDKAVSISVFVWVMFWFVAFVGITAWNLVGFFFPDGPIKPWDSNRWFNWMMFSLIVQLIISPITAVWLTWGGIRDLLVMFRILKEQKHSSDDGYVAEETPTAK